MCTVFVIIAHPQVTRLAYLTHQSFPITKFIKFRLPSKRSQPIEKVLRELQAIHHYLDCLMEIFILFVCLCIVIAFLVVICSFQPTFMSSYFEA